MVHKKEKKEEATFAGRERERGSCVVLRWGLLDMMVAC